jgi:transposase
MPVIPPKCNRKTKRDCDFAFYCERNLIERFFNKIKHFRAIATPHDKLVQVNRSQIQGPLQTTMTLTKVCPIC